VNPNETSSPNQPTRFVEHPGRRRAWRAGQRNLAWGIAFLFAALSVLGVALFIGGARAMLPLLLSVLSFTALWVLARMKIFAQRNGVFFSLAIVALLGALAALLEQAWFHLARRPGAEPRVATSVPAQSARVSNAGTSAISAPTENFTPAPVKTAVPAVADQSALDKQASAQVTKRAQAEAARRYPSLGRAGSRENTIFVEAYNDLKHRGSDLLDDPEWPLELAQTLAQRLGWKEAGVVDDETPAVVEPQIAPGTKVLAEPIPREPAPSEESDIPPPPRALKR
jgi:hypothetical protein